MKTTSLILICVMLILGDYAFAQQANSTSFIEFETINSAGVPIFEVVGQSTGLGSFHSGGKSGFMTTQGTNLQPAFMAPTSAEITNGWHRYQIGESSLFRKKFDVVADGRTQRWLVSGGNPGLNILGWLTYTAGVGFVTFGGLEWMMDSDYAAINQGTAVGMTIGGAAAFIGGLVLVFKTLPRATRIQ